METLYGVHPERIELVEDGAAKCLVVRTRFYEVRHDLQRGGAICDIRYANASGENLLLGPVVAIVQLAGPAERKALDYADLSGWGGLPSVLSDEHEQNAQVSSSASSDEVRLRFSGLLRNAEGKDAGVRYEFEYRHRWGYVRMRRRLIFPAGGLRGRRISAHRYVLRPTLTHWGYRPAAEAEPSADPFAFGALQSGVLRAGSHFDRAVESRFMPRYVVNAEPGREGLEWFASSDLSQWGYQVTGRPGCGSFSISPTPELDGICVDVSPLCLTRGSTAVHGTLQFDSYLGLPVISGRAGSPFLHRSFRRRWPTEQDVKGWAEDGVATVHFHHDGDSFGDGVFWRDGTYPPFGPEDMAQYDRVIQTCHDNGIRVATYFSNKELHPTTQAYKEHAEEWGRKADDTGALAHNYFGKDEFGAQMCLRSGWLDLHKQYIDTVLSHHELDGVYFDWNAALYCNNPHQPRSAAQPGGGEPAIGSLQLSPAGHWDMDELIDLMEWTRQRVGPEGLIIIHNTMVPCAATANFADYVLTLEWGYGRLCSSVPRPEGLPLEWSFMGSRSQGVILPCLLKQDCPEAVTRQVILRCLLTGTAPCPAEGLVADMFRPLRGLDFAACRFLDWRTPVVATDNPSLMSAAYVGETGALVLVANLSGEPQACKVRLDLQRLGMTGEARWRVAGPRSGRSRRADERLTVRVPGGGLAWLEVKAH